MIVKNKPKLLKELANSVDNPWDFIEALAALEKMTMKEATEKAGITNSHYYVSKKQRNLGLKVALKFSRAFKIDPIILNRITADFNLSKILKTNPV